jgi:hypothetical protein
VTTLGKHQCTRRLVKEGSYVASRTLELLQGRLAMRIRRFGLKVAVVGTRSTSVSSSWLVEESTLKLRLVLGRTDSICVGFPCVSFPCVVSPASFPLHRFTCGGFPCVVSPASFPLRRFPCVFSPASFLLRRFPVSVPWVLLWIVAWDVLIPITITQIFN